METSRSLAEMDMRNKNTELELSNNEVERLKKENADEMTEKDQKIKEYMDLLTSKKDNSMESKDLEQINDLRLQNDTLTQEL